MENGIAIEMKDYKGNVVSRFLRLEKGHLLVEDKSRGNTLTAWYHGVLPENILTNGQMEYTEHTYSEEFGKRNIY